MKNKMPEKRTQAARSAATRDALIEAARPLFAEHGFAGVGTEAIVHAAGVTRGALYHQFADKTELFAAVFEAVEADLTQRLDAVVSQSTLTDPIELMRLGTAAWLEAGADPEIHRIALLDAPAVLGVQRWREICLRYGAGLVSGLLQYAMSVGRMAPLPIAPLAHILVGALDDAAIYIAESEEPETARREVAVVLDALITGIAVTA